MALERFNVSFYLTKQLWEGYGGKTDSPPELRETPLLQSPRHPFNRFFFPLCLDAWAAKPLASHQGIGECVRLLGFLKSRTREHFPYQPSGFSTVLLNFFSLRSFVSPPCLPTRSSPLIFCFDPF